MISLLRWGGTVPPIDSESSFCQNISTSPCPRRTLSERRSSPLWASQLASPRTPHSCAIPRWWMTDATLFSERSQTAPVCVSLRKCRHTKTVTMSAGRPSRMATTVYLLRWRTAWRSLTAECTDLNHTASLLKSGQRRSI